jgi:hypothetical protein
MTVLKMFLCRTIITGLKMLHCRAIITGLKMFLRQSYFHRIEEAPTVELLSQDFENSENQ